MTYLHPGLVAVSEFARQVALGNVQLPGVPALANITPGGYLHGTCVEASTYMLEVANGVVPQLPANEVGDYLQAMVDAWQQHDSGVSPQGASGWWDATWWLQTKRGLTVDGNISQDAMQAYGQMLANIPQGYTYLIGTCDAAALPGDEAGVQCHGLMAGGIDASGNIVCGDPDNARTQANMPGDPYGGLVAYSLGDLQRAGVTSLTRVHPMAQPNLVPSGWHDDGTTLLAPNNQPVVQGFRQWVLSHPWDPADQPIGPEYHVTHIEEGPGRDHAEGQAQDFAYSRLGWYAARDVFRCWVGWDYHQFRFDNAHCQDPIAAPTPGTPVLVVDGVKTSSGTISIQAVLP